MKVSEAVAVDMGSDADRDVPALKVAGLSFRKVISTSCTVDAITRMYEISRR